MNKIKEQLRQEIIHYIMEKKVSQREAAILFKTQQPNLNKIIKGHLDNFSVDRLIRILGNAGIKVTVLVDEESTV